MPQKRRKPAWFILYILVVLMIVALALEGKDSLPGWANEALGIGIVFFVFGSIALWVHMNTSALLDEEIERAKGEKLVITEYPPTQPTMMTRNGDGDEDAVFYDPLRTNEVTHSRN
jgi:predicted membrane channel-forming protein YqfA (hemolysin III family)